MSSELTIDDSHGPRVSLQVPTTGSRSTGPDHDVRIGLELPRSGNSALPTLEEGALSRTHHIAMIPAALRVQQRAAGPPGCTPERGPCRPAPPDIPDPHLCTNPSRNTWR